MVAEFGGKRLVTLLRCLTHPVTAQGTSVGRDIFLSTSVAQYNFKVDMMAVTGWESAAPGPLWLVPGTPHAVYRANCWRDRYRYVFSKDFGLHSPVHRLS
jgi:hypothetical protein